VWKNPRRFATILAGSPLLRGRHNQRITLNIQVTVAFQKKQNIIKWQDTARCKRLHKNHTTQECTSTKSVILVKASHRKLTPRC